MDPITALGAAASILQFVQFAGSLITTGSEIFQSAQGATAENLVIEDVYGKLKTLSEKLSDQQLAATILKDEDKVIAELSAQCKRDCNELLRVVSNLTVDGKKNRLWKSVKASLRSVWDASKIDEMEKRLGRTQGILLLHISTAMKYRSHLIAPF